MASDSFHIGNTASLQTHFILDKADSVTFSPLGVLSIELKEKTDADEDLANNSEALPNDDEIPAEE